MPICKEWPISINQLIKFPESSLIQDQGLLKQKSSAGGEGRRAILRKQPLILNQRIHSLTPKPTPKKFTVVHPSICAEARV